MGQKLSNIVVTSRKISNCYGCGIDYPRGTRMQRIAWKNRGIFETVSYCPTCQEYWSTYMEPGAKIGPGDLRCEDPEGWALIHAKHADTP